MPLFRSERGLATSVEAVIVVPAVLLVLVGIIQLGIYWHSRNAAIAAAQLTAELSRGFGVPAQTAAGYQLTTRAGLAGTMIDVRRSSAQVSVTVSGSAPVIVPVPGMSRITETAVMPVERVVGP